MKLLLCTSCSDVFKLDREVRACNCGETVGRYEPDGLRAVVNGAGVSLAIDNSQLSHAVRLLELGLGRIEVGFWVRPHTGYYNPNTRVDPDLAGPVKRGRRRAARGGVA